MTKGLSEPKGRAGENRLPLFALVLYGAPMVPTAATYFWYFTYGNSPAVGGSRAA